MRDLWGRARFLVSTRSIATNWTLLFAILVLGGLLRLYRLNALSLWLNEGFTVRFSRLPWQQVIGLEGQYDPHPPLYYAIIKAVAVLVPDLYAGRVVSAVAGMLTIAVLYLLVTRLVNPASGLLAAFTLALSPVHVWYSQEARQYALMTLTVMVSYLALVLFDERPRWRYAALYGAAVLLSIYVEYSALFALLPQILVLVLILHRHRARALPLMVAGLGAVLGFLPWLPELAESTRRVGTDRRYLDVSTDRVLDSIWSLTGFHGQGIYFWGGPTPWDRWPEAHWLFALLVIAVIVVGSGALIRHTWLGLATGVGLFGGTIALAATLSLVSPAYVERTILPAVLGWCVLLGAMPFVVPGRFARVTLLGVVVVVLLFSLVSLGAVYQGDKQHWDELAAATEQAAGNGEPLITAPATTATIVGLYEPEALDEPHASVGGHGALPSEAERLLDSNDGVWYAYDESSESIHIRGLIEAEGFERQFSQQFRDRLYLELYTRE